MIGCIAGRRGVARSIKFFNKSIVAVLFCTTALMSTMSDSFATDDYGIYSYKDSNGPTSVKVKGRVNGNLDGIHVHIEGAQSSTTGSGDSDITIEAGAGDIIGGRDGIFVNNYGAGATNIATEATISGGRTGIQVVNGKTSTDVTINAKGTVTGVEFGIGIDNYGTGATLINSDGEVQATEYGIFATNKEPTTTDLTIISNGTIHGKTGIAAENYGSGITTVNVNADVSGVENSGLYVDTRASDAIVDIGSGRISGKKIGIDLSNTGNGSAEITNHGIVEGGQVAISAKSVNGNKINLLNKGEIFNTSAKWDDLAIESSGGSLSLVNDELVTGRIISGSFNDSFSNHNLWQTIGVTDFGDGDDTVANENLVITANSANAETTTFSGLEKFINRGVLKLSDNAAGDRTITSGDYVGESDSVVEIDTELGDDNSLTDQLVIEGNSSGSSHLLVNSLLGNGRPTNEGIKVIDVKGNSAAVFSLSENSPNSYLHDGQQTMVAGAFAYKLYKHAASASDGDWYLRSQLKNPLPEHDPLPVIDPQPPIIDPQPPVVDRQSLVVNQQQAPLYQAGAPVYETYAQTLQALSTISTLKQRVGNRHWSDGKGTSKDKAHSTINAQAIWARIEGSHAHVKSETSTTGANHESNVWRIQSGLDGGLYEGNAGVLFGGITAHYGTVSTDISSAHGEGDIDTTGYGVGANLTWYGDSGLYIDGQAQATWYDTDLNSDTANLNLVAGNRGFGYGLSIEAGKRIEIDQQWQITPQAQLVYSDVEFDSFTDAFDARVELKNGGSLKGRIGAAVEYENSWLGESGKAVHTNLYGIANLYYEFLDGTKTDISATSFISRSERLTGGLGLGGDYTWQDGKYAVYGEVSVITTLAQLGDNYSLNGTTGFKVKW